MFCIVGLRDFGVFRVRLSVLSRSGSTCPNLGGVNEGPRGERSMEALASSITELFAKALHNAAYAMPTPATRAPVVHVPAAAAPKAATWAPVVRGPANASPKAATRAPVARGPAAKCLPSTATHVVLI